MNIKQKIERLFNLKPESQIASYPGSSTKYINDSYTSFISVLIEYFQNEFDQTVLTEKTISKGVENYLDIARIKIKLIAEEVPKNDLDRYYSELIRLANIVVEDLNKILTKPSPNPSNLLFDIPKTDFYEIVKNNFQQLREYLLNLKFEKDFQIAIYEHFSIHNGIIYWTGTLPFLGSVLKNVSDKEKFDFQKPADYVRYFLSEKSLINIGSREMRTLETAIRNSNINRLKQSEKMLLNYYTQEFIMLDKKRKI